VVSKWSPSLQIIYKTEPLFHPVTSVSTWIQSFTPKMQNISIHQHSPVSRPRRQSSQYHVLEWCYCHMHNIWWTWFTFM